MKELQFGASFVMVGDNVWCVTGCNASAGGKTKTVGEMVMLKGNDDD